MDDAILRLTDVVGIVYQKAWNATWNAEKNQKQMKCWSENELNMSVYHPIPPTSEALLIQMGILGQK